MRKVEDSPAPSISRSRSPYGRRACLSALCCLLAGAPLFPQVAGRPLRFLGNQNIPPVAYNKDGKATGLAVEIALALGKEMSRPVEVICMDWSKAQELVAKGEADALLQINQTEERRKIYDFSEPLLESRFSIFTLKDRVGITGASSLRGLRVGVEKNGLPHKFLQSDASIALQFIPDFVAGFRRVGDGELDAVVVDYLVGAYVLAENHLTGIRVSGDPVTSSWSAIAVKKGNAELLAAINGGLEAIRRNGVYERIQGNWAPKEALFMTREEIDRRNYRMIIAFLVVLCLMAAASALLLYRALEKRRIAEGKYRTIYEELELFFSATLDLLCIAGTDGRFLKLNRRWEAEFGFPLREFERMKLFDLVHPDDRDAARAALAGAGDDLGVFSTRCLGADGVWRWIEWRTAASGDLVYCAGRDMTERKRAEEERNAHLRFFRSMDRVNRAIQGAVTSEAMMSEVLDITLEVFDCDRAILLHPCDPEATEWRLPMSRVGPGCAAGERRAEGGPMDREMGALLGAFLEAGGPSQFGLGARAPLPAVAAEVLAAKALMGITLRPRTDAPWLFAILRCGSERTWEAGDEKLFQEIAWRLSDALSSFLTRRELESSEENLRRLNAELERRVEERTAELQKNNDELERVNRLFVGRELRMIELKNRIKDLEVREGGGGLP
jgi:PAS domain S-box-containing protein